MSGIFDAVAKRVASHDQLVSSTVLTALGYFMGKKAIAQPVVKECNANDIAKCYKEQIDEIIRKLKACQATSKTLSNKKLSNELRSNCYQAAYIQSQTANLKCHTLGCGGQNQICSAVRYDVGQAFLYKHFCCPPGTRVLRDGTCTPCNLVCRGGSVPDVRYCTCVSPL